MADLPERYGPYTTAYNRFNRWSARGIWGRMFAALAAKSRDSLQMIDSTIVKAHRAAAGAKGGAQSGDRHQPRRARQKSTRSSTARAGPLSFAELVARCMTTKSSVSSCKHLSRPGP